MSLQFAIGMLTAAMLSAGCVALQKYTAGQSETAKIAARHKAELAAFEKRWAAEAQTSQATYSWIPPVNCQEVKCLALTFDDGPNPYTTPEILHELEKANVPASFFVVGSRISGNEDLLRRMWADGDEIGNHSWNHPDFAKLKPAQIRQQIRQTQTAVENAGAPAPTLFRPPYGTINKTITDNVDLTFMLWNEDPEDWQAKTPQDVVRAVMASASPGGVIDLHDIYHVTADSIGYTIKELKSERYHFVTVSQLLNLKPGQKGQYYGRL